METSVQAPTAQGTKMNKTSDFLVVGLGASAGGLEALEIFFDYIHAEQNIAFVVIQHLSPDFDSLMAEILVRHTSMRLETIKHGMPIIANTVYLNSPKQIVTIEQQHFVLNETLQHVGLSLPIDAFFQSLAAAYQERAIAVILSGTGSDGSRGVKSIHDAEGVVMVQNPHSAAFDGMPNSAIATGVANCIANPDELAMLLNNATQAQETRPLQTLHAGNVTAAPYHGTGINKLLFERFNIDFSQYKSATIQRRITHRMELTQQAHLPDYLSLVDNNPNELNALYRELLIEVTDFFRDADVFTCLKEEIMPKVFSSDVYDDLRIWIAGCATGEEVYSYAILIFEHMREHKIQRNLKIFATDVHAESLEFAGQGVYDKSKLQRLPIELLERYFTKLNDNSYKIKELIRKPIVFARHDMINDPPFTKMDLVSCRNVLIYFLPKVQARVLANLHFGLKKQGTLVLGSSESLGELANEFDVYDRNLRIFRKIRNVKIIGDRFRHELSNSSSLGRYQERKLHSKEHEKKTLDSYYISILEQLIPAGLLIDDDRHIIHAFGAIGDYLKIQAGGAPKDAFDMTGGNLKLALTSCFFRAKKQQKKTIFKNISVENMQGEQSSLDVSVMPIKKDAVNNHFYLLAIEESIKNQMTADAEVINENIAEIQNLEIKDLAEKLRDAKTHLQITVEELESSNEELQSANEELLASNEELQSTNEELSSVNEELFTVNAEHQRKIVELAQANNDINNLLNSSEIATIFLDNEFKIRLFTSKAAEVFRLMNQDVGRPISCFAHHFINEQLFEDIKQDRVVEREIHDKDGQYFLLRVLPYLDKDGSNDGTIITFTNISSIKLTEHALKESELRLNLAVKGTSDGLWDWIDVSQDKQWWSERFYELLGYKPNEVIASLEQLNKWLHKQDINLFNQNLQQHLVDEKQNFDVECRLQYKERGYRWFRVRGIAIRDKQQQALRMAGSIQDIHDRKQAELLQEKLEKQYRVILNQVTDGWWDWFIGSDEQYLSPNFKALLGYADNELANSFQACRELIYPDDLPLFDNALRAHIDEGKIFDPIIRYRHRDGNIVWVLCRAVAVKDNNGTAERVIGAITDINQLKETEHSLARSNQALEEFAYLASHDLKEPLRGIYNYANFVLEDYADKLDDKGVGYLHAMSELCQKMIAKLDALLHYSRVNQGKLAVETIDIKAVVKDVKKELQVFLKENHAKIIVHPSFPQVSGDKIRLHEVFHNLILNAVKYNLSDEKLVEVGVCTYKDEYPVFYVRDNGIGIEQDYLDKIFVLFKRIQDKKIKALGSGVGLTLIKNIIERHQGHIWVESEYGQGSTFYFTLGENYG